MDYEINVVQQDPLGLLIALNVSGPEAGVRESLLYLIRDGLNLPGVATGADDEVIGKTARCLIQFEDGEVLGLLFLGGGNGIGDLLLQFGFLSHETSAKPVRWNEGHTEARKNERGRGAGAQLFSAAYADHLSAAGRDAPGARRRRRSLV